MRRSLYLKQFSHANPIPAASLNGPLLMTGVINGNDPETGELPADLDSQCRNMFSHIRAIIEAAGTTTDSIVKVTVWLQDRNDRDPLNREWLAMFPDENSRPARHAIQASTPSKFLIQCDFTAWLG